MDELAGLTGEARKRALDRFHLLQPHLENDRPLKAVAAAAGIPFRTAQRWVSLYRQLGLAWPRWLEENERTPGSTARFQPSSKRPSRASPYRSRRSRLRRSAVKPGGWHKIWAKSRRAIGSSIASSPRYQPIW